jgi:AcrR family transcriptional regulator
MPVKPERRPYDSPRRREQAEQTGRAILEAARTCFVQRGYAATSLADIAAQARVSLKTLQARYGTKRDLLLAVWHATIAGPDDVDVPVADRSWFQQTLLEPDARHLLERVARNSRVVKGRAGPIMEVVRAAAPGVPEIGALWQRMQDEFLENQTLIARALARKGALRPGLSVKQAGELIWALNHPSVHHLLVCERGWSPGRYERWLAESLMAQLLAPAPTRARAVDEGAATRGRRNR